MGTVRQHHYCCFPDCTASAEWHVTHHSSDPYDDTEACSRHVGDLLTDAPEHTVTPIVAASA